MNDFCTTDAVFAQPAKDDEIEFLGLNSSVLVPHGKGQEALDAILSEIGAHYARIDRNAMTTDTAHDNSDGASEG